SAGGRPWATAPPAPAPAARQEDAAPDRRRRHGPVAPAARKTRWPADAEPSARPIRRHRPLRGPRSGSGRSPGSSGALAAQADADGADQDDGIAPERPVADVVQVQRDAPDQLLGRIHGPAGPVDLGPAGDAGGHEVA